MKQVFLDLGNSRFKWINSDGLISGGDVTFKSYPHTKVQEYIVTEVSGSLADSTGEVMLAIASVRGATFDRQLGQQLDSNKIRHIWVTIPDAPLIRPAYSDWSQFGIDRYLNLVSAAANYQTPLIIVSAGTAVTFDLLDAAGEHRGGCIFPGLELLRLSLSSGTAQIGESDVTGDVLATSTAAAVAGGAVAGLVSAVDGITLKMANETSSSVTVLLTGGDAERLNGRLTLPTSVDSLLLFKGMDKVSQTKA